MKNSTEKIGFKQSTADALDKLIERDKKVAARIDELKKELERLEKGGN
jgi:hypothetical protein